MKNEAPYSIAKKFSDEDMENFQVRNFIYEHSKAQKMNSFRAEKNIEMQVRCDFMEQKPITSTVPTKQNSEDEDSEVEKSRKE